MGFFRKASVAFFILLGGCSPEILFDDATSDRMNRTVEALIARDLHYFRETAHPELLALSNFDDQVQAAFNALPSGAPEKRMASSHQIFTQASVKGPKFTDYVAAYHFEYPDSAAGATIRLRQQDGVYYVAAFHVRPLAVDAVETHAFNLTQKSLKHWLVLPVSVLAFFFPLGTLIFVIRMRKKLRRPILWGLCALAGIGKIYFNWTTGDFQPDWMKFGFGGGGERPDNYSPWIFYFYIPIGSVFFWVMRWRGRIGMRDASQKAQIPDATAQTPQ